MLRWIGNCLLIIGSSCGAATWPKPTTAEQILVAVTLLAGIFIHVYDECETF
jgi:hypothetical protein